MTFPQHSISSTQPIPYTKFTPCAEEALIQPFSPPSHHMHYTVYELLERENCTNIQFLPNALPFSFQVRQTLIVQHILGPSSGTHHVCVYSMGLIKSLKIASLSTRISSRVRLSLSDVTQDKPGPNANPGAHFWLPTARDAQKPTHTHQTRNVSI